VCVCGRVCECVCVCGGGTQFQRASVHALVNIRIFAHVSAVVVLYSGFVCVRARVCVRVCACVGGARNFDEQLHMH